MDLERTMYNHRNNMRALTSSVYSKIDHTEESVLSVAIVSLLSNLLFRCTLGMLQ